ncbi:MAG: cysteine hydrolase, partial [Oscillospiraceae bacterium]|nr:cysteine hydrolase [Oscillospiraceae bacterium]
CIRGTEGWALYGETGKAKQPGDKVLEKPTFPSLELGVWLQKQGYEQIELVGLVSYMCVLSNAVIAKAALPEAQIIIDANCTDGPDGRLHEKGLELMRTLQMTVVNA